MKTHWKKQFNYEYMGSYSLPDGRDIALTIKETKKKKVTGTNGKEEDCFVCYFEETDKPMILNRTNCKTIEKIVGTGYVEEWPNTRVKIGIDKVNAFGITVDALRIRPVKLASLENIKIAEGLMKTSKLTDVEKAPIRLKLTLLTIDQMKKAVEYLRTKQ